MEVVDEYLAELARRMRDVLGDDLLGVYAGGSLALGAYEPGRSDVDVSAVVAAPLAPEAKQALVAALRHEALPCPARGLELVVYPLATVQAATSAPGFDLNLNTGERMASASTRRRATSRASGSPSTARSCATTGSRCTARRWPSCSPRSRARPCCRCWRVGPLAPRLRRAAGQRLVLNTARALHFADTGVWVSKREAGSRYLEAALNRLDRG